MSDLVPTKPEFRFPLLRVAIAMAIPIGVVLAAANGPLGQILARANFRPHAPDLALLAASEIQVKIHLAAAVVALALGTVLMIGGKGTPMHRTLGWICATSLMVAAVSSLFIHHLSRSGFSFIHLLSGWTILILPFAVYWARTHRIVRHGRSMTSVFYGGLVLAGLFAFIPGRLLWQMFFG
jgi:uncharacterized membrane protein